MNSSLKKLKRRRFNEINNRLKKINAEDVRSFLLKSGYFPESQFLPNDFFTTKKLVEKDVLKKIKELKHENSDEGTPSFLFFPKSKYAIRALGVPPIENYLHLSNFIADNWKKISTHLRLGDNDLIIPYSYPLFFKGKKRSDIGINNYKLYSELDIPRAVNLFNYGILLDIKNFYPSVYTHTLAWCLDSKTKEKKERCNFENWANKFDSLTRKLYKSRTKGLLIGPCTSDLASEILLRTIDRDISRKILNRKNNIIGFRFKDDYVLFSDTVEDADFIIKEIQHIFNEYHLEANENKTRIIHTDSFEDKKTWKVEVEILKNEINEVYEMVNEDGLLKIPEKKIRLWMKKIQNLYQIYNDEYIIKTILGNLIREGVNSISITKNTTTSCPHTVALADVYISIFSYLSCLCKKVPSSWPLFLIFICLCLEGSANEAIERAIRTFIHNLAESFTKSGDSVSLIWALYVFWRCKIDIDSNLKKKIKNKYSEDNWLIMSFIDSNAGVFSISGGTRLELVNKKYEDLQPLFKVVSIFGYGSKN